MGTAVTLRDVVGIAKDIFVIAVVPLQGAVHANAVTFAQNGDRGAMHRRFIAVEIFDEGGNPPLELENILLCLDAAFVAQHHQHARIQKGQFPQPMRQGAVIEFCLGKGLG